MENFAYIVDSNMIYEFAFEKADEYRKKRKSVSFACEIANVRTKDGG